MEKKTITLELDYTLDSGFGEIEVNEQLEIDVEIPVEIVENSTPLGLETRHELDVQGFKVTDYRSYRSRIDQDGGDHEYYPRERDTNEDIARKYREEILEAI
jgi:hypothetical protein